MQYNAVTESGGGRFGGIPRFSCGAASKIRDKSCLPNLLRKTAAQHHCQRGSRHLAEKHPSLEYLPGRTIINHTLDHHEAPLAFDLYREFGPESECWVKDHREHKKFCYQSLPTN
ncbi:putative parathyroid hormone 2 receptor [Trichinella spiralis]|uniref:putative parathyroid hormone 2 receptor n=1 Tax=Trichinella spiralis TaxID=6334 RepID=UPI0001EFCC3F|nr:putative parathyroid hormone 2 receptor [Trichinella spiralis]